MFAAVSSLIRSFQMIKKMQDFYSKIKIFFLKTKAKAKILGIKAKTKVKN